MRCTKIIVLNWILKKIREDYPIFINKKDFLSERQWLLLPIFTKFWIWDKIFTSIYFTYQICTYTINPLKLASAKVKFNIKWYLKFSYANLQKSCSGKNPICHSRFLAHELCKESSKFTKTGFLPITINLIIESQKISNKNCNF